MRRFVLLACLLALSACATKRPWTAEQRAQFASWTSEVSQKIRSKSYYPRDPAVASPLAAGSVTVRFTVSESGAIYTPQITRTSHEPLFDTAALTIVLSAAPFPPPPRFLIEQDGPPSLSVPINFVPPGAPRPHH